MTNPTLRFKSADGLDFPDTVSCTLADISKYAKGTIERKNCLFIGNEQLISNLGGATLEFRTEAKGTEFNSGDILFGNIRPYLKKVWLSDQSGVASPDVLTFKVTNSIPGYLKCILSSERFFNHVAQGYKGSKMPRGDKHQIMNFRIQYPCLEEQQKIASFFTTLDQKIELNERKLEALEELKKGLMQKIFNREIRFKQEDGSDFPKWNNKRLGEVACLNNGRAYKQEELLNEGKYIVLRVGNFFTNEKYYYSNMELESCKYAHKGDLLYCWSASFGPKIWGGEKVIYHYHIWKIDPINIDKNYLYYYLQRDVENLEQEMNGGTMMHLTKSNMELRSIEIPVIEEQTKIASLFIHFDKKIELVLAKINSLKNLKQGFMQQMFV